MNGHFLMFANSRRYGLMIACALFAGIFAIGCGSEKGDDASAGEPTFLPGNDNSASSSGSNANDSESDAGSATSGLAGGGTSGDTQGTSGSSGNGTTTGDSSSFPNIGQTGGSGTGIGVAESGTGGGQPPTQPPSLSGDELDRSTYEVPANAGKNELIAFINQMNQLMAQQRTKEDDIKIQNARLAAAERLFTPEVDDMTRIMSIQVKSDALQRLYVNGDETAKQRLIEYTDVLVRDPSRKVAATGNLYQLGLVTQSYIMDQGVTYEQLREKYVQVISQFPDQAEIFVMAQQMIGAMTELEKDDEAKELLQIAADVYSRSPVPEMAAAGLQMRDQLTLLQLGYEDQRYAVHNDEEGAVAKLVDTTFQLIGNEPPSQGMFAEALTTARLLEMNHHFDAAGQVYDLLEERTTNHINAELAEFAAQVVVNARQRMSLVGQTIEVSGKNFDGTDFDWTPYQGKYVLLVVWSTTWQLSLMHFADYERAMREYAGRDFEVVGLNVDENKQQALIYKSQIGLSWPSMVTENDQLAGIRSPMAVRLGADAPPYTCLIDPEGKIVQIHLYQEKMFKTLDDIFGIVREPEPTGEDAGADSTGADTTGADDSTGADQTGADQTGGDNSGGGQ